MITSCPAIAEKRKKRTSVSIAVYDNHETYVEASRTYGVGWRLLQAAAEKSNITLIPVESSWKASLKRLKANKVDMAFPAIRTEERERWASFSIPLPSSGSGIFTSHDNPVSSIEEIDLNTALIGVSANSVQESFAREIGFKNIYSSVDRFQLYVMLEQKRLPYLFFSEGIVDYYCKNIHSDQARNCLKRVGEHYNTNTAHVITMKNNARNKKLLRRLSDEIMNYSKTADLDTLFRQHDLDQAAVDKWREELAAYK